MESIYIYALRDPRTEEVRYIGKSNNPRKRLSQHLRGDKINRHKDSWIRELRREHLSPELVILEETTPERWEQRERYWIKKGLEMGWPLTNISEGGVRPVAINDHDYNNVDWIEYAAYFLEPRQVEEFAALPIEHQFEIIKLAAVELAQSMRCVFLAEGGDINKYHEAEDGFWQSAISTARRALDLVHAGV